MDGRVDGDWSRDSQLTPTPFTLPVYHSIYHTSSTSYTSVGHHHISACLSRKLRLLETMHLSSQSCRQYQATNP